MSRTIGILAVFLFVAGGPRAVAEEVAEEAREGIGAPIDVPVEALVEDLVQDLDLLELRLRARLGRAETLRALGRLEEALEAFESVDALYEEELARLESRLRRIATPSVRIAPAAPPAMRFQVLRPAPPAMRFPILRLAPPVLRAKVHELAPMDPGVKVHELAPRDPRSKARTPVRRILRK